jgi:hypothetical protein
MSFSSQLGNRAPPSLLDKLIVPFITLLLNRSATAPAGS